MKTKKLMLPLMAFIFAIGLTFAAVNPEPEIKDQANDYLLINGEWEEIAEQPCSTTGPEECRVRLGENGPVYPVYDQMDTSTLKKNDTGDPIVIPPPF
jgi:type 1 fimbria pilin